MGVEPKKQYILENDVEESDKVVFEKQMQEVADLNNGLPDGYEYEEVSKPSSDSMSEIEQSARQEGLISEGYLGGKGASPKEVIKALKNEAEPEGTKEIKEKYEEKKVEELITITATRDLLMNQAKQTIPIYIKTTAPLKDPETGEVKIMPVKAKFMVKRLTESENTHLLNHKLIGKELADMTDEEYIDSSHFRSKLLEAAVVEPFFSAEEWRTKVPNGLVTDLYDEVNKVQTSSDDSALFQ